MKREELMKFAPLPKRSHDLLMAAAHSVEEEKTVKKKMSVALVFILVMVLIAGVALAAISLRDTARQIVETEQEEGDTFGYWPVEKKIALVGALADLNYIEETAEVKQLLAHSLPEKEADRVANEAVARFTGQEASEVSFLVIMQAAWGPFYQWTREEQAWYSQLMVDTGIQKEDHTLYVMPEGPVDQDQAILIARRAIAKGYGVEESALDSYTVITTFEVPEFSEPGDGQPYWHVDHNAPEDMPEDKRLFRSFPLFIHPETGELYETVESILARSRALDAYLNDPLFQAMAAFDGPFDSMSLEDKALWSQTIRPMVLNKQQEDPDFFGDGSTSLLATVAFLYGVPDGTALPQDEALALAERALVDVLKRGEAEIKLYTHQKNIYYDVTDPERPLWKFFFRRPSQYDIDKAFGAEVLAYYGETRPPNCKVEIDARTGAVVDAFELAWVTTLEEKMLAK